MLKMALTTPLLIVGLAQFAHAQDASETQSGDIAKSSNQNQLTEGWAFPYGLSLSSSLTDNQNKIGQDNGQSASHKLGGNIAANFLQGDYELTNDLGVNVGYATTPALDRYVKSEDEIAIETIGRRFFSRSSGFGVYGQLKLETAALDGYNEQASDVDYSIVESNGSIRAEKGQST